MKKTLTLLVFLLASIYTMGFSVDSTIQQGKNFVGEQIKNADTLISTTDTAKLSHKIYADVKTAVTSIASALKVGAEHVYEVLIRQQYVNAIPYLLLGLMGLFFAINWVKAAKNKEEKWLDDEDDLNPLGIFRIIQFVATCVMLGLFMFNLDVITTGFINPEYGAMGQILKWIK